MEGGRAGGRGSSDLRPLSRHGRLVTRARQRSLRAAAARRGPDAPGAVGRGPRGLRPRLASRGRVKVRTMLWHEQYGNALTFT